MRQFSIGLLFLLLTFTSSKALAQNDFHYDNAPAEEPRFAAGPRPSVTFKDAEIIRQKAEMTVTRFMHLLNLIATGLDLEVSEVEKLIHNSYASEPSRIFYDSAIIISDDLRKLDDPKLAKEKTAWNYLRDFELFYRKSESSSVLFSNFRVSEIRRGVYMYVKVNYDCLFNNKTKISDEAFQPLKRVAEIKIEKLDYKWKTWIVDVDFYDTSQHEDQNEIVILEETKSEPENEMLSDPAESITAPEKTLSDEARAELRRKNDSIRTYLAYRQLVDSGKHALNQKDHIVAYQFFNEAEFLNMISPGIIHRNDLDFLQTMIRETRRNIDVSHQTPDQLFSGHLDQSSNLFKQRKYGLALEEINKAIAIRPSDENALMKRKQLVDIMKDLARLESKFNTGNYKEAIKEYDKLIKSNPQNPDYFLGRGRCYEKLKETKKALRDYDQAVELDPAWADALIARASVYEQLKMYAEAIASYTICTVLDPTGLNNYIRISELNQLLNKNPESINILSKGLEKNPGSALLFLNRAGLYKNLKRYEESLKDLNQAIRLDSAQEMAWYNRGLVLLALGKTEQAAFDFKMAKTRGLANNFRSSIEQIASEYYEKSILIFKSGNPDSAKALINPAILLDDTKAAYYYQRGLYQYKSGEYEQSIPDFSKTLELNKSLVDGYVYRGLSYLRTGRFEMAVGDFKNGILIQPKVPDLQKFLGDALLGLKDYQGSVSAYNKAVEISKGRKAELSDSLFARLYRGRGEAYAALSKHENAQGDFASALKSKFAAGEDYYNYGKLVFSMKEPEKGIQSLQKALTYNGNNSEWNFHLGEMLFTVGFYEKAIPFYNKVLSSPVKTEWTTLSLYGLSRCYTGKKEYAKALAGFRTLQSQNLIAAIPSFYTEFGNLFLELNQSDSALIYFGEAVRNSPDVMAYFGKAVSLAALNRKEEAFIWLEKTMVMKKLKKDLFNSHPLMKNLRNEKQYRQLMKKYY